MVTDDQRWVGLHRLPVRDLLKNLELLEHDGALVARQAALNELTKGGINCTRVRRGFFRTVARLCNLESSHLPRHGPHDAVVAGERTVVAAADLARAPIQPDDLDSFGKYYRPPPGAIEELPAPIKSWDDLLAALVVVFAFTHADGVRSSLLYKSLGYDDEARHRQMRDAAAAAMHDVALACARSDPVDIAECAVSLTRECRKMPLPRGHQSRAALDAAECDRIAWEAANEDEDGFVKTRVAGPNSGGMYD